MPTIFLGGFTTSTFELLSADASPARFSDLSPTIVTGLLCEPEK